jgi:hypothetical protein
MSCDTFRMLLVISLYNMLKETYAVGRWPAKILILMLCLCKLHFLNRLLIKITTEQKSEVGFATGASGTNERQTRGIGGKRGH